MSPKSTFSERFKEALDSRGYSQNDISRLSGIHRSTISQYLSGEYMPKQDRVYLFAKLLNVDEAWLMGYDVPKIASVKTDEFEIPIDRSKWHPIPVYDGISAGSPIFADDQITRYEYIECIDPDNHFFLIVHGDSMINAGIRDGSMVLIRRQPCAENGQIVACLINGDSATLKRYHRQGDTIVLQPENPTYTPIILPTSEFDTGYAHILGVAEQVMFKL